jgi:hypothetical protein
VKADYEKLTPVVKASGVAAAIAEGHLVIARSKATKQSSTYLF